jgi:hypothetical protein
VDESVRAALGAGSSVFYDGQWWEVAELAPPSVLLAALPGYKGPDVYRRGKNPEHQAFYFLHELEQIIRQWTAGCYHRQPHDGLRLPEVPGLPLSPLEMFAHGAARAGFLQVPARADLVFDFLKVEWRTIQHYGAYGQLFAGDVTPVLKMLAPP